MHNAACSKGKTKFLSQNEVLLFWHPLANNWMWYQVLAQIEIEPNSSKNFTYAKSLLKCLEKK